MKPKILWIEDDVKYARLLQLELQHVFEFHLRRSLSLSEAADGLWVAEGVMPDAILIDLHLADGKKGATDFEAIRRFGFEGPVFVLSNDETLGSKLEMLSLGVDDYLWKVMAIQELELRLSNGIQRYRKKYPGSMQSLDSARVFTGAPSLMGLTLDLNRLVCLLDGQEIVVTKTEFQFLRSLVRTYPETVPLLKLKQEVWLQSDVESGTINTFIWKVNKKLSAWSLRLVRCRDGVFLQSKDDKTDLGIKKN